MHEISEQSHTQYGRRTVTIQNHTADMDSVVWAASKLWYVVVCSYNLQSPPALP